MIKYVILSVVAYYVFTYYISPMILGSGQIKKDHSKPEQHKKNDDEYIDYEEIK